MSNIEAPFSIAYFADFNIDSSLLALLFLKKESGVMLIIAIILGKEVSIK
jgi:hypothetical protein